MNHRRSSRSPRGPLAEAASEYLIIVAGCAFGALSFDLFMRPTGMASGGVVGISVLIRRLTGLEPAIAQWALNLPLLILGVVTLGKSFGIKTAVGSFLFPFFILAFKGLPAVTGDPLLSAVFAGVGLGLGLGLVFRGRGSVGGLTVTARLVSDRTGIAMGTVMAAQDGAVILAAALVMGAEAGLYALVVVFIMGRVIDLVRVGLGSSKMALVVSDRHGEISAAVLGELDRGLPRLYGEGGYTGTQRPVLMVVLDPSVVVRFKSVARRIDPDAFVVMVDAHEVLGLGFRSRL